MSGPSLAVTNLPRVLAALLAPPGPESIEVLEALAPAHPWLADPVAALRRIPLEHWQAHHTQLFMCGYPHTRCSPFESAWLTGLMGGAARGELQGLYQRAGLHADSGPADYLGAQLEFAGYLMDLAAERGQHLLELPIGGESDPVGPSQHDADSPGLLWAELWNAHLLRWAPKFSERLGTESKLLFYRRFAQALGLLCDSVIAGDEPGLSRSLLDLANAGSAAE